MLLEVLRNWAWLQRTQWMNRNELERIRCERLRQTVLHAYQKVPFYRGLYDAANVPINSIRQSSDISKLPTTTRTELQKTPLQDRTAVDVNVVSCGVNTSSGTTGVPLIVLEDPYSTAYREALVLRLLWAYGLRPRDKIFRGRHTSGMEHGYLAHRMGLWGMLRRKIVKERPLIDLKDQYEFLSQQNPDILIAPVYYCTELARHCESVGKSLSFRIVLTSSAILDDSTRKLIADSFGAEVFDHYGIEEVGGSIAWECPTHYGYHINAESLLVEFLRNGEPVDGNGDVYVTCFHKKATPIIRYFTGDRARYVDDDCPCGRGLPLIRGIQGRIMDLILTSDGRYISPHLVLKTLRNIVGVDQYKVTQNEDHSIEVQITTSTEEIEEILRNVERSCKRLFGQTALLVRLVDKMDSSSPNYCIIESRVTALS